MKRMSFELYDVFEEFNEENLAKNIEFVMRRHKKWSPKYRIVFPAGAMFEVSGEDE